MDKLVNKHTSYTYLSSKRFVKTAWAFLQQLAKCFYDHFETHQTGEMRKKIEVALAKFDTMLKRLRYCLVALVLQSVLYHWEIFCCTPLGTYHVYKE